MSSWWYRLGVTFNSWRWHNTQNYIYWVFQWFILVILYLLKKNNFYRIGYGSAFFVYYFTHSVLPDGLLFGSSILIKNKKLRPHFYVDSATILPFFSPPLFLSPFHGEHFCDSNRVVRRRMLSHEDVGIFKHEARHNGVLQ